MCILTTVVLIASKTKRGQWVLGESVERKKVVERELRKMEEECNGFIIRATHCMMCLSLQNFSPSRSVTVCSGIAHRVC